MQINIFFSSDFSRLFVSFFPFIVVPQEQLPQREKKERKFWIISEFFDSLPEFTENNPHFLLDSFFFLPTPPPPLSLSLSFFRLILENSRNPFTGRGGRKREWEEKEEEGALVEGVHRGDETRQWSWADEHQASWLFSFSQDFLCRVLWMGRSRVSRRGGTFPTPSTKPKPSTINQMLECNIPLFSYVPQSYCWSTGKPS